MIDRAYAGNMRDLNMYIAEHPKLEVFDKLGAWTASQWARDLPPWRGMDKPRGLKEWSSSSKRGDWKAACLCARTINKAQTVYQDLIGVPPVVEGEVDDDGVIVPAANGVDMSRTFFIVLRVAYCKYLVPEVEEGTLAYIRVMQYMLTKHIKLKLLRGVRTCVICVLNSCLELAS